MKSIISIYFKVSILIISFNYLLNCKVCPQSISEVNHGKISFESFVNANIKLKLSEIVSDIKYVPLETSSDCLIGEVNVIRANSDYFFIISSNNVFQFNINGKFIRKIGSPGKGPGEYLEPIDLQIDDNRNSIIILDRKGRQICEYTFNGLFVNSVKVQLQGHPDKIYFIDNSLVISNQILPPIQTILYRTNFSGEVECLYPFTSSIKGSGLYTWIMDCAIFRPGINYFDYTSTWNDTIFRIFKDNKVQQLFIIDYGKYKYPTYIKMKSYSVPPLRDFIFPFYKVLTDRYLFLQYYYHDIDMLSIYDMVLHQPLFNGKLKNSKDSKDNSNLGVINDIDGSLDIKWIHFFMYNSGKKLIRPVQSIDLIEALSNPKVNLNARFDLKRQQFIDLVNKLENDDNPVIQILYFK